MKAVYEMDKAGVMAIAKSPGMQAALGDAAEKKRAEANRMLRAHDPGSGGHGYMARAKVLDRTAVGVVHTTGITTELDQRKHHTLNAINH